MKKKAFLLLLCGCPGVNEHCDDDSPPPFPVGTYDVIDLFYTYSDTGAYTEDPVRGTIEVKTDSIRIQYVDSQGRGWEVVYSVGEMDFWNDSG